MCIRDRVEAGQLPKPVQPKAAGHDRVAGEVAGEEPEVRGDGGFGNKMTPVSYTHLPAPATVLDHVCRLLLEKKKKKNRQQSNRLINQST